MLTSVNKLQTITRRFIQSKILLEPNKYLHLNNIPCNCLIPEFSVKNTNSNNNLQYIKLLYPNNSFTK